MDKNTKIVLKKKLNVTDLAGEKVMVDFDSGKYFLIKGVGNDIWEMIQNEITPNEIIDKLLSESVEPASKVLDKFKWEREAKKLYDVLSKTIV